MTDALDTAENNRKDQNADDQAGDELGDMESGKHGCCHGIGLDHVTDAERGDNRKKGKEHGQPFLLEPMFKVIHGPGTD
jgi:hypothetical protein